MVRWYVLLSEVCVCFVCFLFGGMFLFGCDVFVLPGLFVFVFVICLWLYCCLAVCLFWFGCNVLLLVIWLGLNVIGLVFGCWVGAWCCWECGIG